jgi:hypothetical protein
MSDLKNKKANIIRTKLLLLISNEQTEKKEKKNLKMLNSIPIEEINSQYHLKNFKITLDNKIINGGKNLCMSFSSKDETKNIKNSNNNKKNENLKYIKRKNPIFAFEFTKDLESIKIKSKRKISEFKLKNFKEKKKKKKMIRIEKQKTIEIQKNYILSLRQLAKTFINYSTNKKRKKENYKRQKSVIIKENVDHKFKSKFYSVKEVPEIRQESLKKKKKKSKPNIDLNSLESENEETRNLSQTTKNTRHKSYNIIFSNNDEKTIKFNLQNNL